MNAMPDEEYLTVPQAASLLKVSQSTIWRWIDRGDIPAYRIGQRRIRLKRGDLAHIITPARLETKEVRRLKEELSRPLSAEEQRRLFAAIEEAKRFQQELLERRGGKLFSSSAEDLDELRNERSEQLP